MLHNISETMCGRIPQHVALANVDKQFPPARNLDNKLNTWIVDLAFELIVLQN